MKATAWFAVPFDSAAATDENGSVTFFLPGEIRVGAIIGGKPALCQRRRSSRRRVSRIDIEPLKAPIAVGAGVALACRRPDRERRPARATPRSSGPRTRRPSRPSMPAGLVTGVAPGKVRLTAQSGQATASVDATVIANPVRTLVGLAEIHARPHRRRRAFRRSGIRQRPRAATAARDPMVGDRRRRDDRARRRVRRRAAGHVHRHRIERRSQRRRRRSSSRRATSNGRSRSSAARRSRSSRRPRNGSSATTPTSRRSAGASGSTTSRTRPRRSRPTRSRSTRGSSTTSARRPTARSRSSRAKARRTARTASCFSTRRSRRIRRCSRSTPRR